MAVKEIRSSQNSDFKELKRIVASARDRRKEGMTVLDGVKLVAAYMKSGGQPLRMLCSESFRQGEGGLPGGFAGEVTVLRDGLFRSLSGERTPSGVMALVTIPGPGPAGAGGTTVMLDGIQDPGNLGTILRTAAAAAVDRVIVSRGTTDPWSPKALRAGMGAHFALNISRTDDLAAKARDLGGKVVALDHRARASIYDVDLGGDLVLLVGSEGRGLDSRLVAAADLRVAIPTPGWREPLNAATAAAICLFEALRQRRSS